MESKNNSATINYSSFFDQSTIHVVIDHEKCTLIEITSDEEDNNASLNKRHRNKRAATGIATSGEEKPKKRRRPDFKVSIDLTQSVQHHCVCGKIFDAGPKSRVGGEVSNAASILQRLLQTINIVKM